MILTDIDALIRPDVLDIEPYTPVEPLDEVSKRIGIPIHKLVKLDANENPYGPSKKVLEALGRGDMYHIYPDSFHRELRTLLEDYTGVDKEHILLGAGSDELIDLTMRLFLRSGDKVINSIPSFGMYQYSPPVSGGIVVNVPRREDYSVDVEGVKEAIDDRTKVIIIASPNNPTGNTTPREDIMELLETGKIVVVDEAYYEFSGKTVVDLLPQYDNLIIFRTFSKWAGLAGLRVGYGFFPLPIIKHLWKIKPPYNINFAAQVAVRESIKDVDYLKGTIRRIFEERGKLFTALSELDFLKPYPSEANFILCRVLKGNAKEIKDELERRGILIRYFDKPLLKNFFRVSIGKPEDNRIFLEELREVCGWKVE